MRLGFYYHIPAIQKDGNILVPGYLGRFLDCLAEYCKSLVLFLHTPNPGENAKFDYTIQSENVTLVSLPIRKTVPYRILRSGMFKRMIKRHLASIDAILVRGPSPLLPTIIAASSKMPTIMLLVGDYLAGVDSLPQPYWRKQLIRLWSWVNYRQQLHATKHSLVFVNSMLLFRQYTRKVKHLVETHTTTLNSDDLYFREDTCQTRPIRLLYTGRIDPAKGLMDMIAALKILVDQGEDIVLDLVGWPEKGSKILDHIKQVASEKNIPDRVVYHGYKPVGPELFSFYKQADIYLMASQTSEGFPRTIWEAMAHSLPVIATRVGSIPDFIEDFGLLINPCQPNELAEAIKKLINDGPLRKRLILDGLKCAKENTLETQTSKMVQEINEWITRK